MRILNVRTDIIPPDVVYIGRNPKFGDTKFGNPFRVGRDGTRDQVIELYRRWLWDEIKAGRITRGELRALAPYDVCCHCAPRRCHGEIIRRAVRWALAA